MAALVVARSLGKLVTTADLTDDLLQYSCFNITIVTQYIFNLAHTKNELLLGRRGYMFIFMKGLTLGNI